MVKHVKIHLNRFLRRVRIHGGEFDTSARAMYRVSAKGSLITYEKAFSTQAEPRIVRGSTIERKQMSTKTTIKRLALVTVAALGLGVLSVAPSNAAVQLDSIAVSATSTTQTIGETLTATSVAVTLGVASINTETMTVTATIKSGPAFIAPLLVWVESTTAATTGTGTSEIKISGRTSSVTQATAKYSLYLDNPTVAGTYVVALTPTGHVNAVKQEVTIVVSKKTVGKSSAFIGTAVSSPIAAETHTADATAANLTFANTAATLAKARIDVATVYGTANDTVTAADAPSVVVATDKGLVSKTNQYSDGAKSVTTAAATANAPSYWVFSNGDIGKASITITVGGVLLATKTVTFTGPATAIVATLTTGQPAFAPVAGTTTYTITATDSAAGAATALPTGMTVKSSDTSVATAAISGNNLVTVTGVKAGTATITVTDPATTSAATAATFVATVAPVRPTAAPTITFDAVSYEVGSLVTMTVSANMADSATAQLFTSTGIVLSAAVVASGTAIPTNGQHAMVSGKATYKFYAPAVSGSLAYTATTGGAVDITTAATVAGTIAITNAAADAATVAAEAAEAAAQDATDAALDATEAAQEAGALAQEAVDLVTALSAEVTKLIAGVRASITYLTKLVMKLAAKK